jgi:hypothetical protein
VIGFALHIAGREQDLLPGYGISKCRAELLRPFHVSGNLALRFMFMPASRSEVSGSGSDEESHTHGEYIASKQVNEVEKPRV